MMPSASKLFLVLAVAAAVNVGLRAQDASLITRKGEYESIRITKDDIDGVEAKQGAAVQKFLVGDVVRISYRNAPETFKKASNAFDDGDYSRAADGFEEVISTEGLTEKYQWLNAYAHYYLGESLSRIGQPDQAVAAFEKVVAITPQPRFVADVYVALSTLYLRKGEKGNEKAREYCNKLLELAKSKKSLGDRYMLIAELGLAKVELNGAGDANKALASLEALITKSNSHPEVQSLIRLEIGYAYNKLKNYERGESYFAGIVDAKAKHEPEVLAGALNGLGDALIQQNKYTQAIDVFSKTYVFFLERADQRERVGHALYYGAVAYERQAGIETDQAKKDVMNSRARKLRSRCAKEFANTAGGAKARGDLGR